MGFDSFPYQNSLSETEIEETIDDISELDYDKQFSDSDSGGGSNAIISKQNIPFVNPYITQSAIADNNSKDLSQKPHLFILYCCLKLDC